MFLFISQLYFFYLIQKELENPRSGEERKTSLYQSVKDFKGRNPGSGSKLLLIFH